MSSRFRLLALLLLAPIMASGAETFAFDIGPGKFDEHRLKIDAGATKASFAPPTPMTFA